MRALRAFEDQGLEYVLIGATVLDFQGLVRATEDVDLQIRATTENVERLRRALQQAYSGDPNIEDIRTEDLLGDHPAVRHYPVGGELFFDILTRLGGAASYETVASEVKEVQDMLVQVATWKALYQREKDTARPIDRRDATAHLPKALVKSEIPKGWIFQA